MHVLLATAQPDLRVALEVLLSEEPGVFVVGGVSEAEGLLALTTIMHPDLVMMDWDLPGRSPAEVLSASRAIGPQTHFIVLSSHADDQQAALDAGGDAFVVKGNSPQQLLTIFRALRSEEADHR
jgi:DNA-binding NarL/FixJ family response regulator